jgi:hypothetical protein
MDQGTERDSGWGGSAAPALVSYSSAIAKDFDCIVCGSSLRGLEVDVACPNCGASVGQSLSEPLRNAPGGWLRMLARGAWITFAGAAIFVIGRGAAVPLTIELLGNGVFSFLLYAAAIGKLIMIVGSWILTEPNPTGIGEDRYGSAREFVRAALTIALVDMFLGYVAPGLKMMPRSPWVRFGIKTTTGLLAASGQVVLLYYLGSLALRIPSVWLARLADFLKVTMGMALVAYVLLDQMTSLALSVAYPHSVVHLLPQWGDLFRGEYVAERCLVLFTSAYGGLLLFLALAFRREAASGKASSVI